MTGVLIFSVAEEAKEFIRKVLDTKLKVVDGDEGVRIFYLVESLVGPSNDNRELRRELKDNESFETDFIGASPQDCRKWALEQQSQHNFIEKGIIAIVDARSAADGTVLMSYFSHRLDPPLDFGKYGHLPREGDAWYDFRLDYERAIDVPTKLLYVTPGITYPVYFGLKEELTDERGIFDAAKAEKLMDGEDRTIFQF